MTQAWNLSQLGNKVNSSGQLDASTGLVNAAPIANGGTNNASLGVTAGGVVYTDGSKQVNTGAGTAGQVLTSAGASAPTWSTVSASAALSTATGTAPSYSARAWVNFNGTSFTGAAATYTQSGFNIVVTLAAHGYQVGHRVGFNGTTGLASNGLYLITAVTTNTITCTSVASVVTSGNCNIKTAAILGSANIFNVASENLAAILVGNYSINFTTAMPSANYACTASCNSPGGVGQAAVMISQRNNEIAAPTAQSQVIYTSYDNGSSFDAEYVNAVIFA